VKPRCAGGLWLLACALCAPAAHSGPRLAIHGRHVEIERQPIVVKGLRVVGRADVVVKPEGRRLGASAPAFAPPAELVPQVSSREALRAAERAVSASGMTLAGARHPPELALLPSPHGLQLVWEIDGRAAWPGADRVPGVLLDAQTGRVLALWNEVERFDRARVYPENPVVTPALDDVVLGTDPASTHIASAELETFDCVDQHDTRSTPIGTLHLCHLLPVAQRDANGDFLLEPAAGSAAEDPFAEVEAFFAARRALEEFQGFGLPALSTQPLPLVVNMMLPAGIDSGNAAQMSDPTLPLEPYAGAAYRTSSPVVGEPAGLDGPAIWLGQGSVADMAYDSDVVSHEMVHAVVDSTVRLVPWMHADDQGLSGSPSALNEGLADYFAGALAGDPHIGEYAAKNFGLPEMRSIEGPARCPEELVGEPHADSLIVSRALWSVRRGLAPDRRSAFDEAVFDALVSLPTGEPGFDDFGRQLIAVVQASEPAVLPALRTELAARGIYPACRRALAWTGSPLEAPIPGGRYVAPGLYDSPWANNGRPSPLGYAPGIVQFTAEVPPGSAAVTVRFQAWDANPAPRVVLARDGRIDFDWNVPQAGADRDAAATSADGQHFEAHFALPRGTERLAAMIVDSGTLAFTYSTVDFGFEPAPPAATQQAAAPALVAMGGCACHAAPEPGRHGAALLLLGALGFMSGRRRARRRARTRA
jgi:MYXO-CTERM domain-containing protein